MDKDKQPGISFDGIILVEDDFKRDPEVPDGSNISFGIEVDHTKIDSKLNVEVSANLELVHNDKNVVIMKSRFIGIFSTIEGEENMDIDDFVKYNAVALMIPYTREHISSITLKAGIDPIILPPINVYSLYDE